MSKNLIPQIAQILGVEIGEKFKVKGYNGVTYRFDADGLKENYDNHPNEIWTFANATLGSLLAGKLEIIKLPWKPKKSEKYWGFLYSSLNDAWLLCLYTWGNNPADFAFYKAGWVFRTKEEAEDALPKVAAKLGVDYKL